MSILLSSMRYSSIISDACSCDHWKFGLATGITSLSKMWLNGPCPRIGKKGEREREREYKTHHVVVKINDIPFLPRSWQRPASLTHFTSSSVMANSGWSFWKRSITVPARCETPIECSKRLWLAPGKTKYAEPSWMIHVSVKSVGITKRPLTCFKSRSRWNCTVSIKLTV